MQTGKRVEGQDETAKGAHLRGPKTSAGKARVALNAVTHGILSARSVLPNESRTEWEEHRARIVEDLRVEGPIETALAERAASAIWRLRRVAAYEEASIEERQNLETTSARLLPHPLDIDKICRYESHLVRQLTQALHELEARQALRRGKAAPLVRVDLHGSTEGLAATGGRTGEA